VFQYSFDMQPFLLGTYCKRGSWLSNRNKVEKLKVEKNLRDRFLNHSLNFGGVDATLRDGNCDTVSTRRKRLGQRDGRCEEGKDCKEKGV
jgi:hypothetical protein